MKQLSQCTTNNVQVKLELNQSAKLFFRTGRAFARFLSVGRVVIGHDSSDSCTSLKRSLVMGLLAQGCDVLEIGPCSKEQLSFSICELRADGGVLIIPCHDGQNSHSIIFFGKNAALINSENGLDDIHTYASRNQFVSTQVPGNIIEHDMVPRYAFNLLSVMHCLAKTPLTQLKPCKVVVNCPTHAYWDAIEALQCEFVKRQIPITFIQQKLSHNEALSKTLTFMPSISDAMQTSFAVVSNEADFGVVLDPYTVRCHFIDNQGKLIEDEAIAEILALLFIQHYPNDKVVLEHDPSCAEIEPVTVPVSSMRNINASYGFCSEKRHHFRHLAYSQSALLPWLLLIERLTTKGQTLEQLSNNQFDASKVEPLL